MDYSWPPVRNFGASFLDMTVLCLGSRYHYQTAEVAIMLCYRGKRVPAARSGEYIWDRIEDTVYHTLALDLDLPSIHL